MLTYLCFSSGSEPDSQLNRNLDEASAQPMCLFRFSFWRWEFAFLGFLKGDNCDLEVTGSRRCASVVYFGLRQ